MFRATSKQLVSPYFRFLMETKGQLKTLPIPQRGPAIAKLFYALSEKEKAALAVRAAKTKSFKNPPPKHDPHTYASFLKVYKAKKFWQKGNNLKTFGKQAKDAAKAFQRYKRAVADSGKTLSYKIIPALVKKA